MIQIGDRIRKAPSSYYDNENDRRAQKYWGEVVYIHPTRPWYVLEFHFPRGSFRESFFDKQRIAEANYEILKIAGGKDRGRYRR